MVFKRLIIFLILLTMLVSITSCGNSGFNKNAKLTVYMLDYDTFISQAVQQFNRSGEYGTAETKVFYNDQFVEYANRLQAELGSGKGPDVIIAPAYNLPSLSKYIKSGVFCNLDEFIKNDKSFKLSDYNQKIMDCGVFDGKRYLVPLNYSINALYTTKQRLEQNGITVNNNRLSIADLQQISKNYLAAHGDDGTALTNYISLLDFGTGKPLLDVGQNGVSFDAAGAGSILPSYKDIASAFYPAAEMTNGSGQIYKDGKIVFECAFLSTNVALLPSAASEDDSLILPIPSFGGNDEIIAKPQYVAAINSNCASKKEAFELVKLLLSNDVQNTCASFTFPVNNATFDSMIKEFSEGGSQARGAINQKAAGRILEQMDPIIKGNIKCYLIDPKMDGFISGGALAFAGQNQSVDNAVSDMGKQITEFFNSPLETETGVPGEASQNSGTESSPNQAQKTITVDYFSFQTDVANAIRAFNESRSDVQVKGNEIGITSGNIMDELTKLSTQIMAGEGSDVLIFNPKYFNSFYKAISSGAFTELSGLIQEDETFSSLNLNRAIIDSAKNNGELYYIPLEYNVPMIVTFTESMQKNGITADPSTWTQEDFRKMILDYTAQNKAGNKYFITGLSFNSFTQFSGRSFIDMAGKTCSFDSPEFIHLLEIYKDIYPYIMPDDEVPPTEIGETLVKNGSLVMSVFGGLSFNNLHAEYSMAKNLIKSDLKMYPFPQFEKNGPLTFSLSKVASINQNCADKAAALDFIEMLLSEDIQKTYDKYGNQNIRAGMPVNLDALKDDIDYFSSPETGAKGGFTTNGNINYNCAAFSDEFGSLINELNSRATTMGYVETEIQNIISEASDNYLNGKTTAEKAAKDIQEKVALFLNE